MAGRRYSAGKIYLSVIPTFQNVMRDIGREAERIRKDVNKADEEAATKGAKETGRKVAKERVDAEKAANEEIAKERKSAWDKLSIEEQRQEALRARRRRNAEARADRDSLSGAMARQDALAKANAKNLADMEKARINSLKAEAAEREKIEDAASRRRISVQTQEQAENTRAWREGLQAQVREHTQHAKEVHGIKKQQRSIDRQLLKDWDAEVRQVETEHAKWARDQGGRFGQEMRGALQRALKDIGHEASLDVDDRPAQRKINEIRRRMESLSGKSIGIDIDSARARRELSSIERDLNSLDRRHVDIDIRTNARSAVMGLREMRREMDAASRSSGVLADRHGRNRDRAIDAANAFRFFNAFILAMLIIIPMLIPAIAGLTAVLGGLLSIIAGAGAGIGVMIMGFLGIGTAVKALSDVQNDAARDSLAAAKTMRNASRAVRDAEQGVTQARTRAAEAAQDAARRVKDSQRSLADAQAAASERIKDAIGRHQDALERLADVQASTAERMKDALDRQREAQAAVPQAQEDAAERIRRANEQSRRAAERLGDVQENVADRIRDALERQREAQEAVIEARDRAADRIQTALDRQANAERTLERAQRSARDAQDALAKARRDAAREMEDLALRQVGGALAERAARLALFEAEGAFKTTMQDGTASGADRERASIAYERAKLDLEQQIRANKDLKEERDKADRVGVEGSDRVVDAKQRVEDSNQSLIDAEKGVKDAAEDAAEARIEAEKIIAKALRDAAKAERNVARVRRDNARQLRDAERAVADAARNAARARIEAEKSVAKAVQDLAKAEENVAKTRRDNARQVRDAEQAVADAAEGIVDARTQGARQVEDAERAVADAIRDQGRTHRDNAISIRDAEERLMDAQAAYQEALEQTGEIGSASMRRLQEAMDDLSPAGQRFARFLFSLAPYWKELRFAAQEGMLPGVQRFMEDMIDHYGPSFLRFVGEMASELGELFIQMGNVFKGDIMTDFFTMMKEYSGVFTEQVATILLNLMEMVAALATAFAPFGESLGDALVRITEGWADWAHSLADSEAFQRFLEYSSESGGAFLDMLITLGRALINLGKGLAPYADLLIGWFTDFFEWVASLDSAKLGQAAAAIISILVGMQLAAGAMSSLQVWKTFFAKSPDGGALNPLALGLMGLAALVGLASILAIEYEWFADAMKWAGEQAKKLLGWMGEHKAILALVALAALSAYAAWRLYHGVLMLAGKILPIVIRGLTLMGRALFLATSWIGLVVVGIAALVAGLVWLYRNNEPFRNFVNNTWGLLKDIAGAVVSWFTDTAIPALVATWEWLGRTATAVWENYLKPFFSALGGLAKDVYEDVLKPVFEAIWNVFTELGLTLKEVWDTLIKPVLDALWTVAEAVGGFLVDYIFPAIGAAFSLVGTVIQWVWDTILKPVLGLLGRAFQFLWENAVRPVLRLIGNGVTGLSDLIGRVFRVIRGAISLLGEAFKWAWEKVIRPAWRALGDFMGSTWRDYIRPAFNFVKDALGTVGSKFRSVWQDWIKPAWRSVGNFMGSVWRDYIKPAFDKLKDGVNGVRDAFQAARDKIGNIWGGIVSFIASPVRTMLRWIKNNLVNPINRLLDKIGIRWDIPFPDIPSVPPAPRISTGPRRASSNRHQMAATGGVLDGYSPGRDNIRFYSSHGTLDLSGGEAVMRPEWTRAVGKDWVDQQNALARTGGVSAVRNSLGAFRNGGVIDYDWLDSQARRNRGGGSLGEISGSATGTAQSFWDRIWDATKDMGTFLKNPIRGMKNIAAELLDKMPGLTALPGNLIKGIYNSMLTDEDGGVGKKLDGDPTVKDYIDSMIDGVAAGGPGPQGGGMGYRKQIQLIKRQFPSAHISSSYRKRRNTASGFRSYHNRARAIDVTGSLSLMKRMYNWVIDHYGKASPEIYLGPGGWARRYGKVHYLKGITAITHPFNHLHWAHKDGGIFEGLPGGGSHWSNMFAARDQAGFGGAPNVGVYDRGGMVGPGDIALNLGRRPEAVLDPVQTESLKRLADEGFGGGLTYAPQLTNLNGASAREVADELEWDFKKVQRNHKYGRP